jgi:hypothetical protein
MVHGSWFMVNDSWLMIHGSYFKTKKIIFLAAAKIENVDKLCHFATKQLF